MVLKAIRRDHISRRVHRGTSIANEGFAVVERLDGEGKRERPRYIILRIFNAIPLYQRLRSTSIGNK